MSQLKKSMYGALSLALVFCFSCASKTAKKEKKEKTKTCCQETFKPTWESLAKAKPATWWESGKFGIFIHWGPYSVAGYKDGNKGYAEAITNHMYQHPEKYVSFFKKKFGAAPPEFGYKDWVKLYTAENWNPKAWAELFKNSGARYVIPTGEHHDGFVNWDSDLTEWCATKKGPKRDLIGDLAKAVRSEGLKFGISYHRERHPSRFTDGFKVHDKPFQQVAEEIKRDPSAADLYGPFDYSDEFISDYVARWKEAEDKYQPDFMWIDDVPILYAAKGDPQVEKFENAYKKMISDYLNHAKEWGKEVYFNNKGKHRNFPEGVGCDEMDNMAVDKIGAHWQNPATLGISYAYMQNEEIHDLYKTPEELVRLLVDVVSKNGNLLLNIGPRADGTIPEGMQRRLLAMGKWLKHNGDAIYDTKPWKVYGEFTGDIIEEKEVHYNNHSMRIHEKEYRYTSKNNTIFVTSFQNDAQDIHLHELHSLDAAKIKSVETMDGQELKWSIDDHALVIKPKKNNNFYLATVYKVNLNL
ncbi:alpha-L-fucosidase [Halosquirtibacter laminarini]|uniref:Alpha-L-fucosidase n=1 Tax=Halosquirtibacter laminarini TaxID=3374600 RepID=A0AC61NG33_9BACT|nr:alpha-L-fucosidase [Prolixibacteraceae bacterium]